MSEVMENIITDLQIENKELKEQLNKVAAQLDQWEHKFKQYSKEEAQLLFKIQKVKQKLNNMKISKSGKNNFQNYSYYELEDINKPITDCLIEEGLASCFSFKNDTGCLQIVECSTGAFIQWCTPILTSTRWQKTLEDTSKKGDVGDIMKAKQALQTYARRTLYLQALEISEPNIIERPQPNNDNSEDVFIVPEDIDITTKSIFQQIKKDFGNKVSFNHNTIHKKLDSMKKYGKIDENMYKQCLEIIKE